MCVCVCVCVCVCACVLCCVVLCCVCVCVVLCCVCVCVVLCCVCVCVCVCVHTLYLKFTVSKESRGRGWGGGGGGGRGGETGYLLSYQHLLGQLLSSVSQAKPFSQPVAWLYQQHVHTAHIHLPVFSIFVLSFSFYLPITEVALCQYK